MSMPLAVSPPMRYAYVIRAAKTRMHAMAAAASFLMPANQSK
jgi:hypothetical protein